MSARRRTSEAQTDFFFVWSSVHQVAMHRAGHVTRYDVMIFFCLDAAWLNEGRCPGGRPSVSYN